jgi:hypothetical protein
MVAPIIIPYPHPRPGSVLNDQPDGVLVLAHETKSDGGLSDEGHWRLDRSLEIAQTSRVPNVPIFTVGGYDPGVFAMLRRGIDYTEYPLAHRMKAVIEDRAPGPVLIGEDRSLDTVMNLVGAIRGLTEWFEPKNAKPTIAIPTLPYHAARIGFHIPTIEEFDRFTMQLHVYPLPPHLAPSETPDQAREKVRMIEHQWIGAPLPIDAITERLVHDHAYYNPENLHENAALLYRTRAKTPDDIEGMRAYWKHSILERALEKRLEKLEQ